MECVVIIQMMFKRKRILFPAGWKFANVAKDQQSIGCVVLAKHLHLKGCLMELHGVSMVVVKQLNCCVSVALFTQFNPLLDQSS